MTIATGPQCKIRNSVKKLMSFIWNSNLIMHPVFLFGTKSGTLQFSQRDCTSQSHTANKMLSLALKLCVSDSPRSFQFIGLLKEEIIKPRKR